jgi:flagellar biosynthesis protein FlhB
LDGKTLILPFTRSLAMHMLGAVAAILVIVAAADYLFQYRPWFERHKMSLRELKEEFRQTEGDPTVKGRLRQLRPTRMRGGAEGLRGHPNPTHFAVALEYERGMNAPVCVAKGVDLIARKIRDVAREQFLWSRIPRSTAPCTARSRWTRKSRPNITGRSPKSSATSRVCAVPWARRSRCEARREAPCVRRSPGAPHFNRPAR